MTVDLQIGRFVAAFNLVTSWVQAVNASQTQNMMVDARGFEDLRNSVRDLVDISDRCGFAVINGWAVEASQEIERIHAPGVELVTIPISVLPRFHGALARLKDSVIGETRTRFALILDQQSKNMWEPSAPLFGSDFKDRFSGSQYDLDEAAKCLALARGTAAVFHLVRILEASLRAVHQCLGIAAPFVGNDRNWGNILRSIREEIGRRGKHWPRRDQFQEIYALLDAVKDAWRNPTMHIEIKYTPEEATNIYAATRGFMTKIAALMDENGDPRA